MAETLGFETDLGSGGATREGSSPFIRTIPFPTGQRPVGKGMVWKSWRRLTCIKYVSIGLH